MLCVTLAVPAPAESNHLSNKPDLLSGLLLPIPEFESIISITININPMPDPNETLDQSKQQHLEPSTPDLAASVAGSSVGEGSRWDNDKARHMAAAVQQDPNFSRASQRMDERTSRRADPDEALRHELAAAKARLKHATENNRYTGRSAGYSGIEPAAPGENERHNVRELEAVLSGDDTDLKDNMHYWAEKATSLPEEIYDLNPEVFKNMSVEGFLAVVSLVSKKKEALEAAQRDLKISLWNIEDGSINSL
jgi:hypothetical protein